MRLGIVRRSTTLAATVVVAGAGIVTAIPMAGASTAPAAVTATPAAQAKVTDGWTAVVLARPDANDSPTGPGRLVLVSPTGVQRPVTTLPAGWRVLDVSGDGARILVQSPGDDLGIVRVDGGAMTKVAGTWPIARFTKPTGQGLLVRSTGGPLLRTDLTGRVMARFASTAMGRHGGEGQLVSPDGRTVVSVGTTGRLQANGNATGAVVRTFTSPAGYSCSPAHFSDATHFTASCYSVRGAQTFRYSLTSSAPVAVTSKLPTKGALQIGYNDAWSTPVGQVVSVQSPCGPPQLGLVKGTGVTLLKARNGASPMGVIGTGAYYLNGGECSEMSDSLSRYELRTGANPILLGGAAIEGYGIASAVLVDSKQ